MYCTTTGQKPHRIPFLINSYTCIQANLLNGVLCELATSHYKLHLLKSLHFQYEATVMTVLIIFTNYLNTQPVRNASYRTEQLLCLQTLFCTHYQPFEKHHFSTRSLLTTLQHIFHCCPLFLFVSTVSSKDCGLFFHWSKQDGISVYKPLPLLPSLPFG